MAACAALGGGGNKIDLAVTSFATAVRSEITGAVDLIVFLTQLGSAPVTLALAVLGALLIGRQHGGRALILLTAVIFTRLAVEGLKLLFGRIRPVVDPALVQVHSFSFPSGHSANSMVTYVLLACFVVASRFRRPALIVAVVVAFLVGMTRVLLGVHWLSDVVGGWTFGLLVATLALAVERRSGAAEE